MRNEKGTEYRSDRFICHMCWNSGFLLWNLRSTEESAQEIIPEVQPEPMSEQSVSDSDVSGNGAENSGRSYGIAGDGRKRTGGTGRSCRAEGRRTPGRNDLRGKSRTDVHRPVPGDGCSIQR